MPYTTIHHDIKDQSEIYHYLISNKYNDVLIEPTSFGREMPQNTYKIEREAVDVYMINYIVKGKAGITYCEDDNSQKTFVLSEGDCSFFYLGGKNSIYPLSNDLEWYYFHVKGGNVQKFYHNTVEKAGNVLQKFPIAIIKETFESLRKIYTNDHVDFLSASMTVTKLLYNMMCFSEEKKDELPPLIMKIIQIYINQNTSVEELSKTLGFHPVYLERQFKKYMGISLRTFIKNRKLELAQNLLLTTNLSIQEIANYLGYTDSNGLIQLFKNNLKTTPMAYRKSFRQK